MKEGETEESLRTEVTVPMNVAAQVSTAKDGVQGHSTPVRVPPISKPLTAVDRCVSTPLSRLLSLGVLRAAREADVDALLGRRSMF